MQIRTRLIAIFASVAVTFTATLAGMLYSEHSIHAALYSNSKAYEIVTEVSAMVGLATEINKAGLDRVERQWIVKRTSLAASIADYDSDPANTKTMVRDLARADSTFHELVKMMEREMEEGVKTNFMQARLSRYNHLTVLLNNLSTTANKLATKNFKHVKAVQKSRDISFACLGILLCILIASWLYVLWLSLIHI